MRVFRVFLEGVDIVDIMEQDLVELLRVIGGVIDENFRRQNEPLLQKSSLFKIPHLQSAFSLHLDVHLTTIRRLNLQRKVLLP